MTYLPKYKAPFILANFNGTSGDVDVITHECGHAFQGYISSKDPIREHADITMETAEIHSMSMEFFTEGWMQLFFGGRSADYVDMHLEDAASFIPYGCMVDEFQHIVYEQPDLTPEQRKQAWLGLEKKYRPYLDITGIPYIEEGTRWQYQMHIYESPFYYIDYCLAQTVALGFLIAMHKDYDKAFDKYIEFSKCGGTVPFPTLVKNAGLPDPFGNGSLDELGKGAEDILKSLR